MPGPRALDEEAAAGWADQPSYWQRLITLYVVTFAEPYCCSYTTPSMVMVPATSAPEPLDE